MLKERPFKTVALAYAIAGVITFSPIAANAELGDTVLEKGITHEDVSTLQEYLMDLGYLNIEEISTYYDKETEKAVKEFQKSQNLQPNGTFDERTYDVLINVMLKYEPITYRRTLSEGISGEDVNNLQERLKVLGFLDIDECTYYFGSMTKEALTNFQKEYGIEIDGNAGPETFNAINKALSEIIKLPDSLSSRASSNARDIGTRIVAMAKEYLGSPYSSGGSSPKGFDCSGFTSYIYAKFEIELPRSSSGQASAGTKIAKEDLQPGDLLIFSNTYKSGPSHTGIYIGDGKLIHSSTSSRGVIIDDLNSDYYSNHFSYGRRVY